MIHRLSVTTTVLIVTIGGWLATAFAQVPTPAPPTTQAVVEPQASVEVRVAELQERLEKLPVGSAERTTLATHIMELKKQQMHAPSTTTVVQNAKAASSLPVWAVEQIKKNREQPIERDIASASGSLSASERDLRVLQANLNQLSARERSSGLANGYKQQCDELKQQIKQNGARLADLRDHLRAEEAALPSLLQRIADQYPNGVVRCPACHGTGQVTEIVGYAPPATLDSGRSIGGGPIFDQHKCQGCNGLGLVGRDAAYDKAVAAITPAQIKQKRATMVQQWESFLKFVNGKAKSGDSMPAFSGDDAIFLNEISRLPQSAQVQRVITKLAEIVKLTDEQVAEMVVYDGGPSTP